MGAKKKKKRREGKSREREQEKEEGACENGGKNFPENIYRTVCPKPAIKNPLGGGGDIGGGGCRWYSPPLSRFIT